MVVNLRKSFDGLARAVQKYLRQDPASVYLFVFFQPEPEARENTFIGWRRFCHLDELSEFILRLFVV